ncbi:MAG: type II secretion system F family protein, partial [Gammaproteobacteria bacterium]
MLITALLVTTGMLTFVIPQFEVFFSMAETDLPRFTRFVIYLSQILQNYWSLFAIFVFLSTCTCIIAQKKSSKTAYLIDKIGLQLPIVGKILKKAAIARFSRTLAITYVAGLPLVEALKCVAQATGNLVFTQATHELSEKINAGQSMTLAMREQQTTFPTMVTQMIAVGEASGSLEKMLIKVASFYDDEVNNAVDSLNRALEPLMTIILSVLIGGILIAMYLPIFKLGSII